MQQHLSVSKQFKVDAAAENTNTLEAIQFRQLTAALWLEQRLNQLQSCINDCLMPAFSTSRSAQTSEIEIFQTVVKKLSDSETIGNVAIALPNTSKSAALSYRIGYVAPTATRHSKPALPAVVLITGKILRLQLGEVVPLEDLQQLQTQKPQGAWPVYNDQGMIVCWLITSTLPPSADSGSLEALKTQLRPQLMQRAVRQCAIALLQLRRLQDATLQCQQLEVRTQELVRANQFKSEFLANTSHEIRTPLSSILGFTHLLLAQGYSPSNLRHQEYLNIILDSGQHLLAVINDILDLSKIEANQLEMQWGPVDVTDLCHSAIVLVKEKASDKGLELRLDLDPHATTLVADALRLKQMLFNLLSNGLKFTSHGTVGLQVKHRGVFLHFTVWDTGIGISKEQQDKLFQPYSQIANAVVGYQEGTGLGLALTQRLAELHGGWVEIQSELNRGSQFTLVLPMTPAAGSSVNEMELADSKEPNSSPPPHPVASLACNVHILLVEDDPHNAKLMTTYLRKLGHQVTWANKAAQMWQALERTQPEVILMDVHLPDVDGLTLARQLSNHEQYRVIPVIAQTAMAMKGDRETCLAAGVTDYISKPIDLTLLATLISKHTKSRTNPN